MITSNISLGKNVFIEKTSTINNVRIGDESKIAGYAKIFGSVDNVLQIGKGCYVGINSIIEGFNAKVTIGNYVSFAQNVNLFSGSGPNASKVFQKLFPITKGKIKIGDHTWIGASTVIMPNTVIGRFCIVAANSFVNSSFPDYTIIGGSPAKKIRTLTSDEIKKLELND
jgi:acetyltransferase-like isoleucine patch superfamily enzyme